MLRNNTKNNDYFGSSDSVVASCSGQSLPSAGCGGVSNNNSSNTNANIGNNSKHGMNNPPGGGRTNIRGAVSGFFRASVLLRDTFQDNNKKLLPEPLSNEKLMEKHAVQLKSLRLTERDVLFVLSDADQFHKIQAALRARQSQTDALVKQIGVDLIRQGLKEMRAAAAVQERIQLEEERRYAIAKELTEARIKARQALRITTTDIAAVDNDSSDPANATSPTSTLAFVSIDYDEKQEMIGTFNPALLSDDDSQDGDILEVQN